MTKTTPVLTTISPHEISLGNTAPMKLFYNSAQYDLAANQTIYMEDPGLYAFQVIEDADYIAFYASVTVPDRKPNDGANPNRLVFNMQAEIAAAKKTACDRIDTAAGALREQYITCVPGQAMVYEQKRREAEAYQANKDIDHAEIPHLVAEAAMNKITLDAQATTYITMANQWTALSAQIEVKRLAGKDAVNACDSVAAVQAVSSVDWSLSQ